MNKTSIKFTALIIVLLIGISLFCEMSVSAKPAADGEDKKSESVNPKQEYYELRAYRIKSQEKQDIISRYLEKALVPALNRMSLDRVGVFTVMDKAEDLTLYVLVPYPDLNSLASLNTKLAADKAYNIAAAEYFALDKKDPAYTRIESRLMKAFSGIPVLEMPDQTKSKLSRLFEVRIYESHNEVKAALKVDMFNSGEIQVMRDTKLAPVFFGETLIGGDVPNLTYMLSAPNMEAHQEHWQAFRTHPEWERMKKLPKYKDTVSKITKIMLVPTAYSQI